MRGPKPSGASRNAAVLVACLLLAAPLPAIAAGTKAHEAAVVRILAAGGTSPRVGAGLVVKTGRRGGRIDAVYILAPSGLVRADDWVTVDFQGGRRAPVAARVVERDDPSGVTLLLAVGEGLPATTAPLPVATAQPGAAGEQVLLVGFRGPAGGLSSSSHRIVPGPAEYLTLSGRADPGMIGNIVVRGDLVLGLVTVAAGEELRAIPSTRIAGLLRRWGLGLPEGQEEPPPAPASLPSVVRGSDGVEMALVPAGDFAMGGTPDEIQSVVTECTKLLQDGVCSALYAGELPQRRVYLDAFYIDRYEVTNAQFERFVTLDGYRTLADREGWGWVRRQRPDGRWDDTKVSGVTWRAPTGPGSKPEPDHPVVQVSWHDADAYCRWAGKQLPTEAQWEKAARGGDGRRYPWGDVWDPAHVSAGSGTAGPQPVGSRRTGKSPYDVHDLLGNVEEWVHDWYAADYYKAGPSQNPQGPRDGARRAVRGGAWVHEPKDLRISARASATPDTRRSYTGFRCAMSGK
jgi:formylglycine-generating enzyme